MTVAAPVFSRRDKGKPCLNYPVLIGAGQLTNHPKVYREPIEPLEMMERVARDAEKDARSPGLLAKLDSVQVVNMLSWSYADAPGMLAARVGAEPTHTVYSPIGGETPQRLINETAQAIAEGRIRLALLGGRGGDGVATAGETSST